MKSSEEKEEEDSNEHDWVNPLSRPEEDTEVQINGVIGQLEYKGSWNKIEGTTIQVNGYKDGKVQIRLSEAKESESSSSSSALSIDSSESDIIARVEAARNKITKDCFGGAVYYGQMEGGERHGYGTYTFASGNKYVGEWKKNKMDGNGTHTWANGNKYVGEWKNDKKDGNGTFTWPNSDKYVGQMKDGNSHGQGTKTNAG